MKRLALPTFGPEDTQRIGELLAVVLSPGDTLLLEGELGAGKTQLVRGLAQGLHLNVQEVCSPTFVLMNVYTAIGAVPLVHIDAYRLSGGDDLDSIGFDAATARPCIVAVEWPARLGERLRSLNPAATVVAHLHHQGEQERHLTLDLPGGVVARAAVKAEAAEALRRLCLRAGERTTTTCPVTGARVLPDSPTWPFASENAKMADLHRWLTGGYVVSRELTPDDADQG